MRSTMPRSARQYLEIFGVLTAAVLLVWFVWAHTDVQRLRAAFAHIAWPYYGVAVAALFGYQVFRAIRTRILVNPNLGFPGLFLTICVHCVINAYFPAGIGEFSLVY